jgi:hypothetical protein
VISEARIRALLDALAAREPLAHDLGTPQPLEAEELTELVALGPDAVPVLSELAPNVPARSAAYIAVALGRLGDPRAFQPLRDLRAAYQRREPKSEWDFAVIGQCTRALSSLVGGETAR